MNRILKRQQTDKAALLEQLKRTPIIQIACEKTGVARATYYRWRVGDPPFASDADEAIHIGESLINDMAESQLISLIRDKNLSAVTYWLGHHHPAYTNKVEITGRLRHDYFLTTDEEALVAKALAMVSHHNK